MHQLIDSHCHLDFPDFDKDRPQLLQDIKQAGIAALVVPAVSRQHFSRLKALGTSCPNIFPAYGLHPMFMAQHEDNDLAVLNEWLRQEKPCALGEVGLDFYQQNDDREKQIHYFSQQLSLAQHHQLPVILHVRKAHEEILKSVRHAGFDKGGIVHAYNGSFEQAKRYLDLGFKLGFGGTLTFPHSHKIHDNFKRLPLNALVLETDSPDMATAKNRGNRNNPLFLAEILSAACHIRSENETELREAFYTNTMAVLNLNLAS